MNNNRIPANEQIWPTELPPKATAIKVELPETTTTEVSAATTHRVHHTWSANPQPVDTSTFEQQITSTSFPRTTTEERQILAITCEYFDDYCCLSPQSVLPIFPAGTQPNSSKQITSAFFQAIVL